MPSALTYPGVYVEEIPSGVRTIVGVATSITAFIGRARRGPCNKPVVINSFGDFEKQFGGLWRESTLSFAVRDFFINGGSQAVVVRLYHPDLGDPQANPPVPAPSAKVGIAVGDLKFEAANEGRWGVNLRVTIDQDNIGDDFAKSLGAKLTKADLFNLTVRDTGAGTSERFVNLTVQDTPRRVDNVLKSDSDLLRYQDTPASTVLDDLKKKAQAYADAKKALSDKLVADPKADVTNEQKAVVGAKAALDAISMDKLSTLEKALVDARKSLTDKQNTDSKADVTAEKKAVNDAKKALDDAVSDPAITSDGKTLTILDFLPDNGESNKKGLYALEQADLFNLLCIPPYRGSGSDGSLNLDVDVNLISAAGAYCEKRRAMLLVDPPADWKSKDAARTKFTDATNDFVGTRSHNAALYFPRLQQPNPLNDNQLETFVPCGAVAGIMARTDTQRGVWKAPAGLDATLKGVPSLSVALTDAENGELNPLGINCLRAFPTGCVVWGARTLQGSDQLADEYKYVPVRRTALYIEETLFRALKWVVFEPNDESLWAQVRLNVGAFMHGMFRQHAFQGSTPKEAYFVKCDKETTTQTDIDLGIVNIIVGFAPLKPAEFVIVKIQQIAGQIEV